MPTPNCYDKAVALLARRPHFRSQLAAKLAQRGYPPLEVEAALTRLETRGLLDDRETARAYLASRRARGSEGKARLARELAVRGAPAEVVREVLVDLPSDELPAARVAAARWQQRGGEDLAALARHLARKGFPAHVIVAVLKERPGGATAAEAIDD
jgi:regulatory protein